MFQITQNILEKTEAHILDLPAENKFKQWVVFTRYVIFPFKYLALGLKDFFKPSHLWAISSFILLVTGSLITNKLNISPQVKTIILNIALFFPLVIIIFSIPSTYSYSGANKKNVKKVSGFIKAEGVSSTSEVELLEQNISQVYSRITSRVAFYKLIIGASWAVYMVFFNIEIKHLLGSDGDSLNQSLSATLVTFSITFLITIAIMLLVIGYKRASDVLIKTIEFGCVQYKYELLRNA